MSSGLQHHSGFSAVFCENGKPATLGWGHHGGGLLGKVPPAVELLGGFDEDAVVGGQGVVFGHIELGDIAQAVHEAMAARINAVLNDKVFPPKDSTVLVGGVAKNEGIVKALEKCSGIKFMIPDQPEFAGALGAALIAAS